MENNIFDKLIAAALENGAYRANIIKADLLVTDRAFRDMCASNACGMYGKCYMCPPDVGDIDTLMAKVKDYDYALVYQTVTSLEDSYDYDGMIEARKSATSLAKILRNAFSELFPADALHLSVGGCGICPTCAKHTGEPCRFPDLALPSLESYGINVSALAKVANMEYTNGKDTVTYFGAVLFKEL